MISPAQFFNLLSSQGISLFTGVPDSLLKSFCAYVADNCDARHNIITANEGAAIAIAAGHYLATGDPGLVYMQNSGIGNAVNPLLSLADPKVYSIPMLLLVGWRGEPGVHDEPQHVKQGEVTPAFLEAMDIPFEVLDEDESRALETAKRLLDLCKKENRVCALVVRKGTFAPYRLMAKAQNNYSVPREEALRMVVDTMEKEDLAVSTTGKLSRELFEIRESRNEGHERDFLTVGSMGHACSIALGIALEKKEKRVWCLDGDGALIMHTGALANIGVLAPDNFIHVVFNNGAHESVGAQPTVGFSIDIPAIARAMGYRHILSASREDMEGTLKEARSMQGPVFVELRVGIKSREDLGRPTTSPLDNKLSLMDFLRQ